MSDNVLNFVRCQWCTSGNAADMGHWGKCPGAAERDKAAEARVAEMFAALNAPTESATADQLRRKLLECEEALRTTEACAEKAERERDEALAELRTHLSWGCAWIPEPMTTVDEDGRVCRVEQFNDRGDLLYVSRQTHRPTYLGSDPTRAKHYHEAVYRLVPIEAES